MAQPLPGDVYAMLDAMPDCRTYRNIRIALEALDRQKTSGEERTLLAECVATIFAAARADGRTVVPANVDPNTRHLYASPSKRGLRSGDVNVPRVGTPQVGGLQKGMERLYVSQGPALARLSGGQ